MPVPRVVYPYPRDWLPQDQRDRFGRQTNLPWLEAENDLDKVLVRAAKRQHDLARGIRTFRESTGQSTEQIAKKAGISAPTVRAILNGSRPATIGHLFALAAAVDAEITLTIGRRKTEPPPVGPQQ